MPKPDLGWAVITHPFHPLAGQRFAILKVRKIAGQDVLSLYDQKRGSLTVPRAWTDQAEPSPYEGLPESAPILDVPCLLKVHELLRTTSKNEHQA
jgi:Family of unknown function (DUF5372)